MKSVNQLSTDPTPEAAAASLLEDVRRGAVPFAIEGDDVFVFVDGRQMRVAHEAMKAQIRLLFAANADRVDSSVLK